MSKSKNFVLIGRSGSGKGTQAGRLMKHFGNLHYIPSGRLFRRLSKLNTVAGRRIAQTLREGNLPFDDLATTLWMHEIAHKVKENQGFILDGSPRRKPEVENLDRFLDFLGTKESTFPILIDVSREEAFRRLVERGRADDAPDAINNRLSYYDNIAVEVARYYEDQGRLLRVNGEQRPQKVFEDILSFLRK